MLCAINNKTSLMINYKTLPLQDSAQIHPVTAADLVSHSLPSYPHGILYAHTSLKGDLHTYLHLSDTPTLRSKAIL